MLREDFDDLSQVRHVEQGDPVAERNTAQPTRALELRLAQLRELVLSMRSATESGMLVIRGVTILTGPDGVALHDVVFYNSNTNLYEKALAAVTAVTDGFINNPTAYSFGIAISVSGNKADIMVGGYQAWADSNHKQAMLESTESYRPGVPYFLSDREPGKLTRFAPTLRVQVLIGTDQHFVLGVSWATPEAIENLYAVTAGMRPVGSLRLVGPDGEQNVIVGFDAIEKYSEPQQAWRSTKDSTVSEVQQFGYLIADAEVVLQPERPVYVSVNVSINGTVTVFSADTLENLISGGPLIFNSSNSLTALSSGTADSVRIYTVLDTTGKTVGTLKFRFVSTDCSFARRVIFKFPEDFQGWKHVHAPITPRATAILAGGQITGVDVVESSVGYSSAPTVVITDPDGSGAVATAVIDEWGGVSSVIMSSFGSGYTNPTVAFDSQVTDLSVMNGGSGAELSAAVDDGAISSISITDGGDGYLSNPDVLVVDADGGGSGAVVLALARNGKVVECKIANPGQNYVSPVLIVRPRLNGQYEKTTPAELTVTVVDGEVTEVLVASGGYNYAPGAKVNFFGVGSGAEASITLNAAGSITAVAVTNGGADYDDDTMAWVDEKTPKLFIDGGEPTAVAEGQVTMSSMHLESVEVVSEGLAYSNGVTIAASGGLAAGGVAAQLKAVLDGEGRIVDVLVINPGSGYRSKPTLTLSSVGDGNGAVLRPVLGSEIITAELLATGSGYQSQPTAWAGVPLKLIEVESGGSDYASAPEVTISAPEDPSGTQATAVAVLGGEIAAVTIVNGGSGYIDPENTWLEVSGGGGSGAVLQPIYVDDELAGVEIIDGGYGFTSTPAVNLIASNGSGAELSALIEGEDTVTRINLVCPGSGYATPPIVTIAAGNGETARAQAVLLGGTADIVPALSGSGGLRRAQASDMSPGNKLQLSDFHDDMDDGEVLFAAPLNTSFYYNIKADPRMRTRYPAVPLEKCSFLLNGVELMTSAYNESQRTAKDLEADVILARKTLFWPGLDVDGSPWDREFLHYINSPESGGRDHIIPQTGFSDEPSHWWRLWANTFNFESGRNRAWLHINRASRYFKSGRVVSIGVLSPLRAVDLVSGVESRSDGSPISGQVMITLDNQTNLLSPASEQVDLTSMGDLKVVFVNTTGRMVMVSSILLTVVFQLNQSGATPVTLHAAQVSVGTQEGGYHDIVGSTDSGSASAHVFAVNQGKELLPDAQGASPLIAPNQKVYMRVVLPAGGPILKQLATVRIKGHVL